VNDLFTRTTVEMVALAAEDEFAQKQAGEPNKRWLRWFGGGVAILCGALVGFAAMALTLPDQNEPLLKDLPVVENLELYESVMNVEFLKQLQAAGLFVKGVVVTTPGNANARAPHAGDSANKQSTLDLASIASRREWLESLSTEEKAELRRSFERFTMLSPQEQQALREIDQDLAERPTAEQREMREIMERYFEWWKTLNPLDRYNLSAESDVQKRLTLVKQLRADQAARMNVGSKDPDNDAIFRWARRFATVHRNELPTTEDQRPDVLGRRRLPWGLAYEAWWSHAPKDANDYPPVSDAELRALRDTLSPEKQAQFEAQTGLSDRIKLVRGWIQNVQHEREALVDQGLAQWTSFGPTRQSLNRFRDQDLSPAERDELQKLPEADQLRKLRELYFERRRPMDFPRSGSGPSGRPGGEMPLRDGGSPKDSGAKENKSAKDVGSKDSSRSQEAGAAKSTDAPALTPEASK
jgi:hypothetical protein